MTEKDCNRRFYAARKLVRKAGCLALRYFGQSDLHFDLKGKQDVVTEADRAVEALLVKGLHHVFPDDAFLGEESGFHGNPGLAQALWVIDPIDGTSNFARGIDLWCISIGLVVEGQVLLGIVYRPTRKEWYTAVRGKGAFLNNRPLNVSKTEDVSQARINLGCSFRVPTTLYTDAITLLFNAGAENARLASGTLGLVFVAAGRYDGYWEAHINAWDVAAALCIVSEAGGVCNNFFYNNGLYKGNPVLAANPSLYPKLSSLLGSLVGGLE